MKLIKTSEMDSPKSLLTGLKSIEGNVDFGGDLSITTFETEISTLEVDVQAYNLRLISIKTEGINLRKKMKGVKAKGLRFKTAVMSRFTKESDEYAKMGGVKPSLRRTPTKKKKETTKATV
jgi:hypothetical protein